MHRFASGFESFRCSITLSGIAMTFCILGILNAFSARTGPEAAWQSSTIAIGMSLMLLPVCLVAGFFVSLKGNPAMAGVVTALLLVVCALLLPTVTLLVVADALKVHASTLPEKYVNAGISTAMLQSFVEDFKSSRQWFEHWHRVITTNFILITIGGAMCGGIGELFAKIVRSFALRLKAT